MHTDSPPVLPSRPIHRLATPAADARTAMHPNRPTAMPLHIVLIEDESDYAALLSYRLKKLGHPPTQIFDSGEEAVAHIVEEPDLVLLDVRLPGINGLDVLLALRKRFPNLPVVIISSQTSVDVALSALERGAFDYLTKGYDDMSKLPVLVERLADRSALLAEASELRTSTSETASPQIVGTSDAMEEVYRLIRKTTRSDLTVAIIGESGTGKELIAQAIHQRSKRRDAPFVVVNCAAIPSNLMESTFFGHERGAFTGAHNQHIGSFEQADGGVLFLDEIGDLSLDLQAKLLRVLQNGEFQRVGGSDNLCVDVRVLCATNKDVASMVQEGAFREDLYYRLFQFPITLPPLRKRSSDILLLADHFRTAFLKRNPDVREIPFSASAKRDLLMYPWPGNVRQLKHVVERSTLLADADEIMPADLLLDREKVFTRRPTPKSAPPPSLPPVLGSPVTAILSAQTPDAILPWETIKKLTLHHAYLICDRQIQRTATHLGVTRSTVSRLLKQYNIQ